jgi:cytosine/adenosine deaminase-related metal-dependent hydrolase
MAGLTLPGLVVGHTHLYSTLARGMPPPAQRPKTFPEILERVWWRLDRALDADTLRMSARVGLAEAARAGATCVIDHHESPNFITGSLDVIADEIERSGLRGVVCYGVTARNRGEAEWRAGLAENDRFLQDNRRPLVRGLVGLHAAFTLPDDALRAAGELGRERGVGLHVHVAEDIVDRDAVARLRAARAILPGSVYAHAVHATADELAELAAEGWIVHNARSNMGNAVGYARLGPAGARVTLGTDGWDGDVLAEARVVAMRAAEARDPVDVLARLESGRKLASSLFGDTSGDGVTFEYDAPTPLDDLGAHLLAGAPHVAEVRVDGRIVTPRYDGQEAREAATSLWRKMAEVR